ncbi:transcriptional regulator [Thermoplasmatales archaeon SM1-50]|nr:MAG: transcriptional regulator [Thermoplasmatales archaeon SM1-50]
MKNHLITNFYELPVEKLMNNHLWDIPIIEKNEDIINILNILSGRNHIWVVNTKKKKELIGVITEHDILTTLSPKDFSPYVFGVPDIRSLQHGTVKTAEDIMSTKIITCKPDEKIIDILKRMRKYQLRRLPVVKNKKLTGEITLHRLIQKYYKATQYYSLEEEG